MNKIKMQKKAGQALLVIKSLKGQQLQKNEIYAINTDAVRGLVHMGVVEKKNAFELTYNITGLVQMKEYLATPLNRERFTQILQSILANLKSMEQAYFNRQQLLMEFDKILVNPVTQQVCFIYVPIQYFDGEVTLREFLMSIIQHASFVQGEDTSYVQDYIKILNNGLNFSMFDLEQYINRLVRRDDSEQQTIKCPTCQTRHKKRTKFCNVCGTSLEEAEDKDERKTYVPPIQEKHHIPVPVNDIQNEEADVLQRKYLVRVKSGERIELTKNPFRMGKGMGMCDYCITNNSAVSRQHVDFYVEGGHCYVVDLASTNKTYINDVVLLQHAKYEVFMGDRIKLADEEFLVQ